MMNKIQASKIISQKYLNIFQFYQSNHINTLIYNSKNNISIHFKDMKILLDDEENLKKYYYETNDNIKQTLKHRFKVIINFYCKIDQSNKYHPIIIMKKNNNFFAKRYKQLDDLRQQDQEQSYDQEQEQESSYNKKCDDITKQERQKMKHKFEQSFLHTSRSQYSSSQEQDNSSIQTKNDKRKTSIMQYEDQYDIYNMISNSNTQNINEQQVNLFDFMKRKDCQIENDMGDLILDFGDLDKQRIIKQYNELCDKENMYKQSLKDKRTAGKLQSKAMSMSILMNNSQSSSQNSGNIIHQSSQNITKQSLLIGSRQQRNQETKVMRNSVLLQNKKYQKKFKFQQNMIINQYTEEESPIIRHEDMKQFKFPEPIFKQFLSQPPEIPFTNKQRKMSEQIINYYYKEKNKNYKEQYLKSKSKKNDQQFMIKKQDINSVKNKRQYSPNCIINHSGMKKQGNNLKMSQIIQIRPFQLTKGYSSDHKSAKYKLLSPQKSGQQ